MNLDVAIDRLVDTAASFAWFFGPGLLLATAGCAANYCWEAWADRRNRRLAARIAEAQARTGRRDPLTEPNPFRQPRIDPRAGTDRDALATCEAIWNADIRKETP